MLTCKSPRKVMQLAFYLACRVLPKHRSKFSRHDFTLPQLFACLVVREQQRKSYREAEALLKDAEHWGHAIGMNRTPDHNTLCRAFETIVRRGTMRRMLDLLSRWMNTARALGLSIKPLAIDSTHLEDHYVSRHFENCKRLRAFKSRKKQGRSAPVRRGTSVRRTPKLSLAVAAHAHFVLAVRSTTGMGSDQPFFLPLLRQAMRRASVRVVVADAGYDAELHHRLAREQFKIRSIMPPKAGARTDKLPPTRYRRLMARSFARGSVQPYRQRSQAETTNSMIKRNLGSALRCRTPKRRRLEQLFRVIVHNLMIRQIGSRQSRSFFHF